MDNLNYDMLPPGALPGTVPGTNPTTDPNVMPAYDDIPEKIIDSISTTDCTGLIQTQPQDEEQARSYTSVYDYNPPMIK